MPAMETTIAQARSAEELRALFVRFRQARGLSQSEVARSADVAKGVVQKFERGETIPGIENFLKLAAVVGLAVAVFYVAGKSGIVGGAVAP